MKIAPGAWKDKPALIEVAFPAQKLSIEAQCERKANAGQTLTPLGSYWKGRKPLVLVRACILGALLPSTGDTEKDLEIFEMLMAIDDDAFVKRQKKVSPADVVRWGETLRESLLEADGSRWKSGLGRDEKRRLVGEVLAGMPYVERLNKRSLRPEELGENAYVDVWDQVNRHLSTSARSHAELVEQLGILRFGHRPRVGDTFCGGGSIPFEAARLGCDVYASDLNPIACMLTWGAFNVVGASDETRAEIRAAQERIAAVVDEEITRLGIEHDDAGNRAKAYLYCLEATCPETGWAVPLAPSWIVSHYRRSVAVLRPNIETKRFTIDVLSDVDDAVFESARAGTVQGGDMVFKLDGVEYRTPIRTLRGDKRTGGQTSNDLRPWDSADISARDDDIFRERLYCIHWTAPDGSTFFRAPTEDDLEQERRVYGLVREGLREWQARGWIPDMAIEPGEKTDELVRTRGWTHWHHCFTPRELLTLSLWKKRATTGADYLVLAMLLNLSSKLCRWLTAPPGKAGGPRDLPSDVFYNQALNTFFNFAIRSWDFHRKTISSRTFRGDAVPPTARQVSTTPAAEVSVENDLYVTDPPYADAIRYEEITEFFIAWLRKNPPTPFNGWVWDSRRAVAIKGAGEGFRREMVKAYTALAEHMPDNGVQIVMFTHQDAKVWGDMAGIFWAAGLRVTAAWYIATETTSEMKKGGYVQGTVILVLRKRTEEHGAYKDELVLEVREEVKKQLETMIGLNQQVRARGRSENLFEDADLQMAGYAAALRVLTGYTAIDGTDMTREALRPRTEDERTIVDELIEFAVAIANEELVPDGLDPKAWEKLVGAERFYLRMLDLEAAGLKKLDNYQNFAKAFRVADWQPLMGSVKANNARLKSAREFKRSEFGETEFGSSLLRAVLFALYELEAELETDEVMSHLRDNINGYYARRTDIIAVASYLASKLGRIREDEAGAARVLRDLVKGERLGA